MIKYLLIGMKKVSGEIITIKKEKYFNSYDEAKSWCRKQFEKDGFDWFIDGIL